MSRKALIAAVLGLCAVLGSCVPLRDVVMAVGARVAPHVLEFDVIAPTTPARLALIPGREARGALLVTLVAGSNAGGGATPAASLIVTFSDGGGRRIIEARRDTAAGNLARSGARLGQSGGAELELQFDLPRFVVPADGQVQVAVELPATRADGATLRAVRVVLNDGPESRAGGFTAGVFMLLAGWVAAVAGLAMLLPRGAPPGDLDAPAAEARAAARNAHLAGLLLYVLPLLHLAFLLRAWRRAAAVSAFAEEHAREALNFQLSVLVYLLIAFTLSLALIGVLMLPVVLVFQLVMLREATVQARHGHRFRYPLTFRFVT